MLCYLYQPPISRDTATLYCTPTDSIPTGDRSRWYLYLYVGGMLASVVGPLISVLGFIYWGNDWTLPELRKV